jgi:hypothetical protein
MRPLLALVLMLAALGAAGQTLYRSTMPDGRVVLGDRPMPGARTVQEIQAPAGNVVPAPAPPAARPRPPGAKAPAMTLEAADAELREALKARDAARDAAEKGKEPLEGERLGTAGKGGSRLSDTYWARQKSLEDAVAQAERRVEAAQAKLNALR